MATVSKTRLVCIFCLSSALLMTMGCRKERVMTPREAAIYGDTEFLRDWLETEDGDPNLMDAAGNTLLFYAAFSGGKLDAVKLLLEAGGDPNLCAGGMFSPLMAAANDGDLEMVKLLLEAGADLAYRAGGSNAYDVAMGCHKEEIREYLWKAKPLGAAFDGDAAYLKEWLNTEKGDPNLGDIKGNTLLWYTAGPKGGLDAMKVLLQAGADPNLCSPGGCSPLMVAAYDGHLERVKALLEAGADPTYRCETEKDAYDVAMGLRKEEIRERLSEAKMNWKTK